MNSCPNCARFEKDHNWHGEHAGCLECQARSIARSLLFYDAAKDMKRRAEYKDFIVQKLNMDYEAAHARVKHYAALLKTEPT